MSSRKANKHDRLLEYIALLVIGLVVLIAGLTTLPGGWAAALLGAGITAFGGFEVNFTYNQIQGQNKSLRATQGGSNNIQTNQTSPTNSPVINKAENVHQYFNVNEPKAKEKAPKPVSEIDDQVDWLCNGVYHIDEYQEFPAQVGNGDKIVGHIESKHPLSVQIMNQRNYNIFVDIHEGNIDPDTEYTSLYHVPHTTNCDFSWTSPRESNLTVVITDGEGDELDDKLIAVTARVKIVRDQ